MKLRPIARATAAAGLVLAATFGTIASAAEPAARGVPIVDTPGPGGFLGYWGADVYRQQSVAARFTVPASGDMRLTRVALWLMNNSETDQRRVQLSVQTDALDEGGTDSLPSGVELERWGFKVEALGWNPVEQAVRSRQMPLLQAGRSYWVVARSLSPAMIDPVWTFASEGNMVTTTTANGVWQTAGNGAALTLRVDAQPLAAAH